MTRAHSSKGFSLIEVMVALVVTAIGLLGLAKMESLAVASTTVAGGRSLAAIQAASLASMMHANQDFWQGPNVTASTTVNAANNFATVPACVTAGPTACPPDAMAQYDLQQWAAALQSVLPGYLATITCGQPAGTNAQVNCIIQINWVENAVGMVSQQTSMATLNSPSYTLYVQP